MFDQAGLHPQEITTLGDLAQLSITSKADVQQRRSELFHQLFHGATESFCRPAGLRIRPGRRDDLGGGSGAVSDLVALLALAWHRARNVECDSRQPQRRLSPPAGASVLEIQRSRARARIQQSSHLCEEYSPLRSGASSKEAGLSGLASQLALIASYLVETKTDLGYEVRWITTSSENLLAMHADLIERAFGVRPKQRHGMVEAIANISECDKGKLHADEELGTTEFIPITESLYRVVGTNVTNLAMPLIRYECNDHITIDPGES
jgi:phenylacetate-coenzyme A ligase PaaK-like adenylate-forming protein